MRKLLLSVLMLALFAVLALTVVSGLKVGNVSIGYSIQDIMDRNDELDNAIATLSTEINTGYQGAKTSLDTSFKKLQSQKQVYEETIAYTSEDDVAAANQTEEYKLDYLWTNIGLYATRNHLILKADLSHGSSGIANQYNISITAIGEYLPISEFVYAIEKDPNLGFRIEEFTLVPYAEDALQATFIIKNVAIDPTSVKDSIISSSGASAIDSSTTTSDASAQ